MVKRERFRVWTTPNETFLCCLVDAPNSAFQRTQQGANSFSSRFLDFLFRTRQPRQNHSVRRFFITEAKMCIAEKVMSIGTVF